MATKATPTTTGECTIPGCGAPAIYELHTRSGDIFRECEEHFEPIGTTVAEPETEVGRTVKVRHAGIEKIGAVVKVTPTKAHVEVPVKPHGRPAATRVIVVERASLVVVR